MKCITCGGSLNPTGKCTVCGQDNASLPPAEPGGGDHPRVYRSTRLTIFLVLVMILDIIAVILLLASFRNADLGLPFKILAGFMAVLSAAEVVLCIFMLKLKRWALVAYLALAVINGLFQLIRLNIIPIIFRALLLYFIFRKDWEYFD